MRSPHADAFRHLLAAPGVDVTTLAPGLFEVRGLSAEQVGVKAGANHIVLHELTPHQASLEEAFMDPEWTKLRSLRSTRWSQRQILTVAFPVLAATMISARWGQRSPSERAHFNPLDVSLIGSQIARLAIGVLGVLVISGEYKTGMIRPSFTVVPKRCSGRSRSRSRW